MCWFGGCYTRRGGFTVVWALVTARGGHGVLGKNFVVSNKNMLVSLQKRKKERKKKIPVAQTTVNRCLGPCVLMVVAVSHRRRGSRTAKLPVLIKTMFISLQKKEKKKEKPMYGPNDGKPSFGPSYVDGGGRRLSSSYVLDGLTMGFEDEELTIYVINNVTRV